MELAYLHVDGFTGESSVPGFEGQIELTSFQYGCNQPTIPVQSADAPRTGRAMHYMVKFTKRPDSSSSDFCKAVWQGATIPEAVLTACRMDDGTPVPFFRLSLWDVVVADYNLINSESATKEIISMNFAKIKLEYLHPDARLAGAVNHDLRNNEVTID